MVRITKKIQVRGGFKLKWLETTTRQEAESLTVQQSIYLKKNLKNGSKLLGNLKKQVV